MTNLGRRLTHLEGVGARLEAHRSTVTVYDPSEGADVAVRRLYGSAPLAVLVLIPSNGRDPLPG